MSTTIHDLTTVSTSALRLAVEGGESLSPRTAAIDELSRRDYPFKVGSIGKVLDDPSAALSSQLRAIAAIAREGGREAVDRLVAAAIAGHSRVRQQALIGLGRIADAALLPTLERIAARACASEQRHLDFARLLIALRSGDGRHLPDPGCSCEQFDGCAALDVATRPASDFQIERGVWALGNEAFGVDPGPDAAFSIDMGHEHWLLALDRRAVQALAGSAGGAACVLGIVSEDDLEDPDDYFLSAVLLAEVCHQRGRALAFDPEGRPVLCGDITPCASGVALSLRAVAVAEAPPMEAKLRLEADGRVAIERFRVLTGPTRKTRLQALHDPISRG